jgi:hypothetical protein
MTVHVDELQSDVSVEPETAAAPAQGAGTSDASRWRQLEEFRALREQLARQAERTRADGYGD